MLLDGGRVVADGTHDGLLDDVAEYREVLARAAVEDERRVVDDDDAVDDRRWPLMGWFWGDNVPEETLSRDEASKVLRRLLRMLRPAARARSWSRRSC